LFGALDARILVEPGARNDLDAVTRVRPTRRRAMSLGVLAVFVSYVEFVAGSDTHAGRALTVGLNIPFER
jgi:hypothetical protein